VETITPAGETIGKTMKTETTDFQTVARELSGAFELATRSTEENFYRIRRDAPAWIADGGWEVMKSVHEAVDGRDCRLPDDYIYRLAARAAEFVAGHDDADDARDSAGEFADSAVDVSIPRLFAWASDHANNRALADEAGENIPAHHESFQAYAIAVLQGGQYLAAERVAAAIIDAVELEASRR
jgi:hypothetical protein